MHTALSPQLSGTEKAALLSLEATIQRGLQTFYEVGSALAEIRDSRLYREGHQTFEDYCRDRWGMNRAYANRLVAAVEVVNNLDPIGSILPTTESQVRPLTKLEPHQQQVVWAEAVETAPGGKVTASHVQSVISASENYKGAEEYTPQADIDAALTQELLNRLQQGEPASQIVSSLAKQVDRVEKEARRESFAARRQARAALFTEPIPFDPAAQYNVIYCDPPWRYEHSKLVD